MTLGIGLAIQRALERIERVTKLGQQLVPSVGGYVVLILAGCSSRCSPCSATW
jgi:hypothetical protein